MGEGLPAGGQDVLPPQQVEQQQVAAPNKIDVVHFDEQQQIGEQVVAAATEQNADQSTAENIDESEATDAQFSPDPRPEDEGRWDEDKARTMAAVLKDPQIGFDGGLEARNEKITDSLSYPDEVRE